MFVRTSLIDNTPVLTNTATTDEKFARRAAIWTDIDSGERVQPNAMWTAFFGKLNNSATMLFFRKTDEWNDERSNDRLWSFVPRNAIVA